MADIFLSYARSDRPRAKTLAAALARAGWTVWWDRNIPAGRTFDEVIEHELEQARCVVVLWSLASVKSDWVKEEASEAARRRILVPVLIDDVQIPLGFRRIQAASLLGWKEQGPHSGFERLVRDIRGLIGVVQSPAQESVAEVPAAVTEAPATGAKAPAAAAEAPARADPEPSSATAAGPRTRRPAKGKQQRTRSKKPRSAAGRSASRPRKAAGETAPGSPDAADAASTGPADRIVAALRRYHKKADAEKFHIGTIPAEKLKTARSACKVPPKERVLALIDYTVIMNHAKDCLLFGENAIYNHNGSHRAAVSYDELRKARIAVKSYFSGTIRVGGKELSINWSFMPCDDHVKLLKSIKRAVSKTD